MSHDPEPQKQETPALKPVRAMRFVVLLALAAGTVAATGVGQRHADERKLTTWTLAQAVPNVELISPKRDDETRTIELPGNVEAFYSASIHGQVSGYVQEWRDDIGAKVKRGDILAIVDTPELDQRLTAAEGDLAKAKARQSIAHITAERWQTLRSSAAVSQQAIDEKESTAIAADADVAASKADLDKLHALKTFARITAPFDGVVTARNVDIGSLVSADASDKPPLFVVSDVSRMRIYVRAPEVYSAVLKTGMTATLSLPEYANRTFQARIDTTSDAMDAKSRALLVELMADNKDGALRPGAFAQVKFELPPDPDTLTVPSGALLFRDGATFVATVDDKSRVKMKKVTISRDYGSRVEIGGEVTAADRIVRHPQESLSDGDEVRVAGAKGDKSKESAKVVGDEAD
jgi:RND family efflux transporter MFP subunit